jgi:hypothetical protein
VTTFDIGIVRSKDGIDYTYVTEAGQGIGKAGWWLDYYNPCDSVEVITFCNETKVLTEVFYPA